ncbi:hypothetical protein VTN77DRAFT_4666 [Rasamsonia byssochlamydoides]|uniref:uncharacterized protein n=1 Tax=Rasamsonia byssochlamydoides TaxID=89139 RepID=UPI00374481B3
MTSKSRPLSIYQLSDGRYLSYAQYGNPTGQPVFFFHGFPGSRLEGALWESTAIQLNARLIVPDRPGFGYSSLHRGRAILNWPADVLQLAEHLGIKQFHILATSGGSPYLLACLREIDTSRIRGACIVSGMYPLNVGGVEDMLFMSRVGLFLAVWCTPILAFLLDLILGRAARAADRTRFETIFMKDVEQRPEVDQRCMQDENYKERFLACVRESLKNCYAFVWEARLLGSDWGFALDEISVPAPAIGGAGRLQLWQGGMDVNCPVSMAERAAAKIKAAELNVLKEEGHLSLPANHMLRILHQLLENP